MSIMGRNYTHFATFGASMPVVTGALISEVVGFEGLRQQQKYFRSMQSILPESETPVLLPRSCL